jgi:hypothetical protein
MRRLIVLSIVCAATSAMGSPIREGANHHLGDDSFVATFGRAPTAGDSEELRMATHLVYVRAYLAARPPTRPALAERRAELLGYLDDYIAKGTTPRNTHVPWRTPVFIDDDGQICAVGYLLERSVGRALPERIAATHRLDFVEDIAAAMPEVRAWVDTSGFTLDEIASIQPAYTATNVESWMTWDLVKHAPPDGPFENGTMFGTFHEKALHGEWTVKHSVGKVETDADEDGDDDDQMVVVGTGKLDHGNGTWHSYYDDGKQLLATGPYRRNKAHGEWSFYHRSGNLAARGRIIDGMRYGAWTFYYDTPARTPLARGRFEQSGYPARQWRYYDEHGALLTYGRKDGVTVTTADPAGVTREEHRLSTPMGDASPVETAMFSHALTRFSLRGDQIYVFDSAFAKDDFIYDAQGNQLRRTADGWMAASCKWSAKRRQIAKSGDIAWLHEMLFRDSHGRRGTREPWQEGDDRGPACGPARPVSAARSARLDTMLASIGAARQPRPAFAREPDPDQEPPVDETEREDGSPIQRIAAIHVSPFSYADYVDDKFDQAFRTMAGRMKYQYLGS